MDVQFPRFKMNVLQKVIFLLIMTSLAGCNYCEEGRWKCKNDAIYHCVDETEAVNTSGIGTRFEKVEDCRKYDAVCEMGIKSYFPPGNINGGLELNDGIGCVVPEQCESGRNSSCYNNTIVSCTLNPDKVVIQNTISNHPSADTIMAANGWLFTHCVESEETGEAYFAYGDEECDDGETKCYNEWALLHCEHGYWTNGEMCYNIEKCYDLEDGGSDCLQ